MSAAGDWPARAAVAGVGTMGVGFAQVLALAGIETRMADADAGRAARAREQAVALARRLEDDGLFDAGAAEAIGARTTAARDLEQAADGAELVLEAVTEDPAVKRGVYARLEAAAPAGAVIATNTSAIPIRELSAALSRPARFLGAHWFNPPQLVPCVEVIPGPDTDPAVVQRLVALLARLGKRPVVVGDRAGFVANRIQFAMFKEAASVVADGVASAEEVDAVVRASFGFRLPFFGPFAIADMAGLDVYAGAYAALEADLGPRFAAPEAVLERVAAGRLGTKSGAGFLEHEPAALAGLVARRDRAYGALARLVARIGAWEA